MSKHVFNVTFEIDIDETHVIGKFLEDCVLSNDDGGFLSNTVIKALDRLDVLNSINKNGTWAKLNYIKGV
jgi:hypothetical protein